MRWLTKAAAWAALSAVLVLSACGGGKNSDSGSARLRLINATSGYGSLDLKVADVVVNTNVTKGTVGAYASVGTNPQTYAVFSTGSPVALLTETRTLASGSSYTAVVYGAAGAPKTVTPISENVAAADSGKTKVQLLNLAADAGALDVYLTGSTESLDGAVPLSPDSNYVSYASGTYRLRVTGSGAKTDLRLDVPGVTLLSTGVATLLVTPGNGGVLVDALLLNHKEAPQPLANSQARVRVIGAVAGGATVAATVAGSQIFAAATSPTFGNYVQLPSGSASVRLLVNNIPVAMPDQTVEAGGDYSLLVWGTAAQPLLTKIVDDNRVPAGASNAKIRLVHGMAAPDPLSLTVDFRPLANNVAQGQYSEYATIVAGGSALVEVSSPASPTLYKQTGAGLAAKGVYTVLMYGDAPTPNAVIRDVR